MNNSHVRGFTLIELLIVIAIIGVLAGLGGVAASKAVLMAKKAKARTTVRRSRLLSIVIKMMWAFIRPMIRLQQL